jgi:hypothetical protein
MPSRPFQRDGHSRTVEVSDAACIRVQGRSNIMEQSIGRASQPTTQADTPDANRRDPDASKRDKNTEVHRRAGDVPPRTRYDDTALTDPNAKRRSADPLDPRLPSRETGDPLDPGGHVI